MSGGNVVFEFHESVTYSLKYSLEGGNFYFLKIYLNSTKLCGLFFFQLSSENSQEMCSTWWLKH